MRTNQMPIMCGTGNSITIFHLSQNTLNDFVDLICFIFSSHWNEFLFSLLTIGECVMFDLYGINLFKV